MTEFKTEKEIQDKVIQCIIEKTSLGLEEVSLDGNFSSYQLTSMSAVEIAGEIEKWMKIKEIPLWILWQHPTPRKLAGYLFSQQNIPSP